MKKRERTGSCSNRNDVARENVIPGGAPEPAGVGRSRGRSRHLVQSMLSGFLFWVRVLINRKVHTIFIAPALCVWVIIIALDVIHYHRKYLDAGFKFDIIDNVIHIIIPVVIILLGIYMSIYNEKIRLLNERILHINAILRAIRNVNQLIVWEKDRTRLAREICGRLVEDRGYRGAWLGFTDENGVLIHAARAGAAESEDAFEKRLSSGSPAPCERMALESSGIHAFPCDRTPCVNCGASRFQPGDGGMALRLEHEGHVYGLLRVITDARWLRDEEEHSLLDEVAGDIAFSLHTIKMDMERRAAQNELSKQKERIAEYLRIVGVMFIAIDADETVTLCNPKACDVLGYEESYIVGRNWFDAFIPDQQREHMRAVFRQIMSGETDSLEYFENLIVTRSGDKRTIAWQNTAVRDNDGRITGTLSSGSDVTRQRLLEIERERVFNLSIDMLSITGLDGSFRQVNPAWTRTLGWSEEELKSRHWLDFVHPDDRAATLKAGEQLLRGNPVQAFENRHLRRDGGYRWISWNAAPLPGEGIIVSVARDVTEEKEYRDAIKTGEKRLRALSRQLILSQEEERARVARDIHDHLGRLLTALSLETEWIIQTTTSDASHIRALQEMIDKTTVEMRHICRGLRPIELERMGLTSSIESLVRETREVRPLRIEQDLCRLDAGDVPSETAIAVYRILQEALNNIVKHALAESVRISLRLGNGSLVLEVMDDGRGFQTGKFGGRGIGIAGMRERAALCGGSLDINSEPGKGARLIMKVPITAVEKHREFQGHERNL